MGSLFSSESKKNSNKLKSTSSKAKAAASVTDKDRAILDLKNARDRLKKYRKKVCMALIVVRKECDYFWWYLLDDVDGGRCR